MTDKLHLDRAHLHGLFRQMLRIRRFEVRCVELYQAQKIRGFLHLYDGEEAVAVGVCSALDPSRDAVVATYREHGHALAHGVPMAPLRSFRVARLKVRRSLTYAAFRLTCSRIARLARVLTLGPALLIATRTRTLSKRFTHSMVMSAGRALVTRLPPTSMELTMTGRSPTNISSSTEIFSSSSTSISSRLDSPMSLTMT